MASRVQLSGRITALTTENVTLKARVTGKQNSGSKPLAKPKVTTTGMVSDTTKYIPPQRRLNRVAPTPYPTKKQVTFHGNPGHSSRPTPTRVVQQQRQPTILISHSTRRVDQKRNLTNQNRIQDGKGLRQGDPLSPFLFLLVVEALQVNILDACNKGFCKGLSLADNGLKVNLSKSILFGVGVDLSKVEVVASSLNCLHDSIPFLYLGLLVGKNMQYYDGWLDVIRRVQDIISSWKSRSLSIGDDQKGINWVKWNSVLTNQNKCGLGVRSLLTKNLGLIGKWKWRFLSEEDALWREVIQNFYGEDESFELILGLHLSSLACIELVLSLFLRWKDELNVLPSWVNLIAHGMDIPSSLCSFCKAEDESLDHCLIKYLKIILLWRKV
nr:RNA-directed DNA polymerase, eukaryota, reverse transcriptase zinc-binding domain protein [Tanacetum cinerariifolium]